MPVLQTSMIFSTTLTTTSRSWLLHEGPLGLRNAAVTRRLQDGGRTWLENNWSRKDYVVATALTSSR